MSLKIEGSNPLQCEAEVPTQTVQPAACVDRVEQARVEERAYAGERSASAEALYGFLKAVPTPGVLELEVDAKLQHTGGSARVTARRDATGEFLIRLEGKLGAGVPGAGALTGGVGAAAIYRVRTPEAAADLLHSLVSTGMAPSSALQSGEAARVVHYGALSLERVEVSVEGGVFGHGGLGIDATGGEAMQRATGYVDFDQHLLVTEQTLRGEVFQRVSVVLARTGFEGEVAIKLRTETELPDEVLGRVARRELSVSDALRGCEATRKLVFEGEERSEVNTLFAAGYSQVVKLEAELDLDEFVSNPTNPGAALKAEITTMMAQKRAVGVSVDFQGSSVVARAAIYSVATRHLFQAHEQGALQKELDAQRSVPR